MAAIPLRTAFKSFAALFLSITGLVICALLGVAAWQYSTSKAGQINSLFLSTERQYRVFNPESNRPVVYAFDGQSRRNSLAPAAVFSIAALIRGDPLPRIVAIASGSKRDRDFRSESSVPAAWRPRIKGRAAAFDRFLIEELFPKIEGTESAKRILMGHSLAGLYALELAARTPTHFDAVWAFAPTFSHDLTVTHRLHRLCDGQLEIFVNWGLESTRDTAVFDDIVQNWLSQPQCRNSVPRVFRHYGAIHQAVMLSGAMHIAIEFLA